MFQVDIQFEKFDFNHNWMIVFLTEYHKLKKGVSFYFFSFFRLKSTFTVTAEDLIFQ